MEWNARREGWEPQAEGAFAEAEALLLDRFAHVSLADLARDFARRHTERRTAKE